VTERRNEHPRPVIAAMNRLRSWVTPKTTQNLDGEIETPVRELHGIPSRWRQRPNFFICEQPRV